LNNPQNCYFSTVPCGILAFQGNIKEHQQALVHLGVKVVDIRYEQQVHDITHLIIPGGESTVIGQFMWDSAIHCNE